MLYLYSKEINCYVSRETIKNKCCNYINEVIYLEVYVRNINVSGKNVVDK